jgi:hypothetical protein
LKPVRSVLNFALSEARIIVTHYLRLVFWPRPLILLYGMAPVRSFVAAGLPALLTLVERRRRARPPLAALEEPSTVAVPQR